jgi:hypothetical protein
MEQMAVLMTRSAKTRRHEALGMQRFLNFTLTGIIVGLLWLQRGKNNTLVGAGDMSALLFFEIVRLITLLHSPPALAWWLASTAA